MQEIAISPLIEDLVGEFLSGDLDSAEQIIRTNLQEDSFDMLFNSAVRKLISAELHSSSLPEWLLREATWNSERLTPGKGLLASERLLNSLWQELSLRISRSMEAVRREVDIRRSGAVICFPGSVGLSILVSYSDTSASGAVSLKPLAVTENPQGMLDLESYFKNSQTQVKAAIKSAALSVDKIIYQHGAIVHVDRQKENVFGPTIDTVIIADILRRDIIESGSRSLSVLEIGPGSGLISVVVAKLSNVDRLVSIEINHEAATCTLKNCKINGLSPGGFNKDICVRAEKFAPQSMAEEFDYIVCNPPYIPEVPSIEKLRASGYGAAIGGLDLYTDIFECLALLMSGSGKALMMMSSVSISFALSTLPGDYEVVEALPEGRRKVPLDLDLLWERPDWRSWLIEQGLIEVGADDQMYHWLIPMWVRKKAQE